MLFGSFDLSIAFLTCSFNLDRLEGVFQSISSDQNCLLIISTILYSIKLQMNSWLREICLNWNFIIIDQFSKENNFMRMIHLFDRLKLNIYFDTVFKFDIKYLSQMFVIHNLSIYRSGQIITIQWNLVLFSLWRM